MSHSDLYAEIDRSAYANELAKWSPVTKAFFALSVLVLCVTAQSIIVPIIISVICTVLILGLAKVKPHLYADLLVYPTIMVILSSIIIALFFGGGDPLVEIPSPWIVWSIYKSGVEMGINTFFRVEGALSSLFFLVLTTPITDLCLILRRIHVPKVLVEMSLLIYRYIFVFLEISAKMTTAQKLRLGGTGWLKRIRDLSLLASNLFIRTLEQGERTFVAMNARGYDGTIHVLDELPKPRKAAIAAIVLFDVLLTIVIFLTLDVGVI